MVLLQFTLDIMININAALTKLVNDLRKSSPNLDSSLEEILPIGFSLDVEGHRPIFIFLNFSKKSKCQWRKVVAYAMFPMLQVRAIRA